MTDDAKLNVPATTDEAELNVPATTDDAKLNVPATTDDAKLNVPATTDDDASAPPADEHVLPLEVNGVPMLKEGDLFDGRFTIDSRCGWDDRVGATYFACEGPRELVLRIDASKADSVLSIEGAFLKKVEDTPKHVLFSQIHASGVTGAYRWLALYFREGPSLRDIVGFVPGNRLSFGSAGRFTENLFEILEVVHTHGFLITDLDTQMLHFCAAARKLFLSDISSLRADTSKLGLTDVPNTWRGGPQYAPLAFHSNGQCGPCDELEAAFFLSVELATGELPWTALHADHVFQSKNDALTSGTLFSGLPKQYESIWEAVEQLKQKTTGTPDYSPLKALAKEIYENVGGVQDWDDNFDFEREPTADELPRFVAEKVPTDATDADALGSEEAAAESVN